MTEHGTFFWNQLVTTDQKNCGDFYCGLLGWNRREVDAGAFGSYTIFSCGGADVGGMMNPTTDYSRSRPSWWQAFIAVADVDACAAHVGELGGTIIEPPHDVPGVGRTCMVADPSGAVVQLITPASSTGNAA
jgi:predicted enzyme related to lactoylglutathione lyase